MITWLTISENLYNSQNRFLCDTRVLAQNNGFQMDHLRQDFIDMSADFAVLHNAFQHFVDFHFVPVQDTIIPTTTRTLKTPCGCPVAYFTKDFSSSSPDYLFQARTSPFSVRSPVTDCSVFIQSPLHSRPGSVPPLESVTHSSINSSFHTPGSSIPIPVRPPQVDTSVRPYWAQDSDSELSEEESQDGNSVDSEAAGEELREGFSALGVRNDSV
jgi:hypothetical protein